MAYATKQLLNSYGWDDLSYPRQSFDLAHLDYIWWLFLKVHMGGKMFPTNEEVEK